MNWTAKIRLLIHMLREDHEAVLTRLQSTLTKQQELELFRELKSGRVSRYTHDLFLRTHIQNLVEGNPALCRGVRAYDVRFKTRPVRREFLLPQ